ncbi:hypothetical protein I3760_10G002200 [Carya illinoinensis]|nr:hypothetical protein I3760_10G002200 [Carya illinoinensis]
MQDDLSVNAYFTRLKTLWDELMNYMYLPSCISSRNCNCEVLKAVLDHRQREYAMHFLMELNDTFARVKSQILLIDPFPDINRVFSLILQEERQRGIHSIVKFVNTDFAALVSTTQQQNSHKFTSRNKFSSKPKPMCNHCGMVGHTKEKCYKLHRYPPGYKFTKSRINSVNGNPSDNVSQEAHTFEGSSLPFTQEQCQQLLSMLDLHKSSTKPPMVSHIIDTGATDHMVSSVSFLHSYSSVQSTFVTLPNGHKVNVTHIGIVKISDTLTLTNVLCVPSFSFNLLSVSKLVHSTNCAVFFLNKSCIIQDPCAWRTIGLGEQRDGLYYLLPYKTSTPDLIDASVSSVFSNSNNAFSASSIPAPLVSSPQTLDMWHYRLGHPSNARQCFHYKFIPCFACLCG